MSDSVDRLPEVVLFANGPFADHVDQNGGRVVIVILVVLVVKIVVGRSASVLEGEVELPLGITMPVTELEVVAEDELEPGPPRTASVNVSGCTREHESHQNSTIRSQLS